MFLNVFVEFSCYVVFPKALAQAEQAVVAYAKVCVAFKGGGNAQLVAQDSQAFVAGD